jgi:hypothetical protein
MAKACHKLSPSPARQSFAITPGVLLSPSPKRKKEKQKRAKTLDEEIFSNELRYLCLNV